MRTTVWIATLACAALAGGCGTKQDQGTPAAQKPKPVSTPGQIVEHIAGKTAVDQGRKAQDTIRKVSAQKNQELDDAMAK
jgi:hypothetical protein